MLSFSIATRFLRRSPVQSILIAAGIAIGITMLLLQILGLVTWLGRRIPHVVIRGLQLALKPHGGVCAASADLQRCLDKVGHPNLKIWYDAGNIIYYTGNDPLKELEPIARQVTGFCAKDCPGPKGEVMSQFGTGKVDFKAVFAKLKAAGFNGPIMVEGARVGATAVETTANARVNREYLEHALAGL